MEQQVRVAYETILKNYLRSKQENYLYQGQQLSKSMMEYGIAPEEIVGFHIESMKKHLPHIQPEVIHSLDFLLEVMIGYGLQYQEHQSLRESQIQLQSEIEVAAEMQQTLLPEVPRDTPNIDLGVLSVAAKKMSGDFYHFYHDPNGYLGIAVADIIGKGVPAALSMSMIKFAIESLPEQRLEPHALLGSINRVVENNIDTSMFITMIYGSYDYRNHQFQYATAGHEPGLYYSSKRNEFEDLSFKGLVLGLSSDSTYTEFKKDIDLGDMIILFSDGVTESKRNGQFIDRKELCSLIHKHKSLPAQQMVESIHQELLAWSDFELTDDQTIVVIKRMV
jgi:sigma-B regulation protein RsbU (phosphoserine phosphatase)